jgi:CheY-like chemotaxis protein
MVLAIPMFPNLTEALRIFLQSTLRLMKADAAAVWLISQEGQEQREKELVVSTGFNRDGISKTDEERISRVILEGKMMKIDDLRQSQSVLRTELMVQNGFISYLATPTIVKDGVTGVLELFYCSPYRGKPGEADLLDAIAKQTCLVVYTVQFLIKAYHRDEPKRIQPQPVQSERSSGVQEFISKTAHELNNVLTIIGGYAQLLKVSIRDEELKENVSMIFNEVVKASTITGGLLAFVQKQEASKREVSLNEVLEKAIELKSDDFNSNKIRIVKDLDSPVPLALIDPNQLHLTGEVPKEISGKRSKQYSWLHGKRGLLIDDDVQLMNLLSRFFETAGCEAEVVPDGKSALDKLDGSSYDFIFCDIKMPTMNGITLYQQLKEKGSSHLEKIIFVTGDVTGYDVKEFLESVRNPILAKPFDLEEVKRTLQRMLAKS